MIGYKSKYWTIKECYVIVCDITAFCEEFRFKIIKVRSLVRADTKDHFIWTAAETKYVHGCLGHEIGNSHKSDLFRTKASAVAELKKKLKTFYLVNLAYIKKLEVV